MNSRSKNSRAATVFALRGGGTANYYKFNFAYTLAEIVIVMLIIAVVVSVSIKITKTKLDNIVSYTYYSGYSTLRNVTTQIIGDYKATDNTYTDKSLSWLMNQNPLLLLFPTNNVMAEKVKKYYCASECYESVTNVTSTQCGITTMISSEDLTDSPSNLNCNSSKRWYQYQPLAYGYNEFVKCSKIYNYTDENTKKYWDYSTLQYTYDDVPMYGDYCQLYRDFGQYSGYGRYKTTSYPYRFSCILGEFLYSLADSLNRWPICVIEEDSETTPDPGGCSTSPSEEEQRIQLCQNHKKWQSYPTCGYEEITCPDGQYWSVNDCGCVPEPPTLPRKGINFCTKFVERVNTKSNSQECSGTSISLSDTDFSGKTPDIILRTGMRIYNMSQNPTEIPALQDNTQGGSYDGVPNINTYGYTVYLDIDGEKGTSTLWDDVYKFYITMSGKVIAAYDESDISKEIGGNSRLYLMTSVQKDVIESGRRKIKWLKKSVTFKDGACSSGYIGASTPYCTNNPAVNLIPECDDSTNPCQLKHVRPIKYF